MEGVQQEINQRCHFWGKGFQIRNYYSSMCVIWFRNPDLIATFHSLKRMNRHRMKRKWFKAFSVIQLVLINVATNVVAVKLWKQESSGIQKVNFGKLFGSCRKVHVGKTYSAVPLSKTPLHKSGSWGMKWWLKIHQQVQYSACRELEDWNNVKSSILLLPT